LIPVYDWQKIPGTTALQKPSLPAEKELQKPGSMDFAGAVANGKYGAVGFDFISPHDLLRARKSWFFFDEEIVCLGAGITSETYIPVVTTLNQCLLTGDVFAGSGEKERIISKGEHPLDSTTWVYHNGIAYLFPTPPASVVLSNQAQTGSWYKVNRQADSPNTEISKDVFKLWIDHGRHIDNAEYQYIVMPSTNKEKTIAASIHPKVEILSNTPDIQAVYHSELEMLQAVFYKTGEISAPDGIRIEMESPGIILLKSDNGILRELSVADPLHKLRKIHFTINRKLVFQSEKINIVWNEAKKISEVSVELPQSDFAGKSVTIIN
ncbi:MAG: polysaccharide lyase beta-sandwich domain-containing protein, partial [Candidatus Symbiothrix sp.]|nr:polysaccharide lyase beta-sandwich domain-containing protein [Candidatus Symbiothrix sp.]